MDTTSSAATAAYAIDLEPVDGRIAAVIDGVTVADSTAAILMHETYLSPVLYLPRADVISGALQRSAFRTFCSFKGTATHWNLKLANRTIENAAFEYERPLTVAEPVSGYVAFSAGVVDQWLADDALLRAIADEEQSSAELPLADWIVRGAWLCSSASHLTEQLGRNLVAVGVPLMQLSVGIWTLHPQLAGTTYTWKRGQKHIDVSYTPHGALREQKYLKSPERFVSERLGGVRQRLDDENPEFQFPIMEELRAAGGTDYVAMPLPFSDGQFNTLTLTSDNAEGFSVADLGQVFDCVPTLSRLYEVHTLRHNTSVLLDTYLGPAPDNGS